MKKRGTECDASRAEYADVGSSAHFIWPRVGNDCFSRSSKAFVKNADPVRRAL